MNWKLPRKPSDSTSPPPKMFLWLYESEGVMPNRPVELNEPSRLSLTACSRAWESRMRQSTAVLSTADSRSIILTLLNSGTLAKRS